MPHPSLVTGITIVLTHRMPTVAASPLLLVSGRLQTVGTGFDIGTMGILYPKYRAFKMQVAVGLGVRGEGKLMFIMFRSQKKAKIIKNNRWAQTYVYINLHLIIITSAIR